MAPAMGIGGPGSPFPFIKSAWRNRMDLHNSNFIVTGGASGLGAATVRRLVAGGARIVIADLAADAGAALASELGSVAEFVETDVTDQDSAAAAVRIATERFGPLSGLINCAGIAPGEKVLGRNGLHQLATFQRAVAINLTGTFNMIRLAADAMHRRDPNGEGERGVIVNTASVAAFDGQIGQAAYAASKAGVVGMTLPLARELASYGIRVMTIAPGIFETPMLLGMPQPVQDSLGRSVPFPPRLGRPAEFAELVAHAIENVMLNGEIVRLDGALRMTAK
jgi:NAD(P)-dependent dehydrogenase (short-subunit alcohol dehydrogenase family)